jgi:hypothetical protein
MLFMWVSAYEGLPMVRNAMLAMSAAMICFIISVLGIWMNAPGKTGSGIHHYLALDCFTSRRA